VWDYIVGFFILFVLPMLPLLYVGFTLFLSWLVMRWVKRRIGPERRWKRWGAGLATFAVLLLLPTWNIVAARVYMYYRCSQEAGVTIYRTIELPTQYFNRFGVPEAEWRRDPRYSSGLLCFGDACYACSDQGWSLELSLGHETEVRRLERHCIDLETGELLGQSVVFNLSTSRNSPRSAAICPPTPEERALFSEIFIPEHPLGFLGQQH
jgi:hypothetical protein